MDILRGTWRAGLFLSTAAAALTGLAGPALAQQAGAQPGGSTAGGPQSEAQQRSEAQPQSAADALTTDILVTGRRMGRGEVLQDVPAAVTAFGSAQLEAAHVRDLQGISYSIPNVALDAGGTFAGLQNFMIRGLGVNSSVPSIDPTVGVLVDGIYIGSTYGVLTDIFDLEGIEVLRGPQGVAFGRNVTGGAILLRTKAPGDEFEAKFRGTVESGGPEWGLAGAINLPAGGIVSTRLTAYYKRDEGYFKSSVSNHYGESETFVIRPQLRIKPTSETELILRYEHGKITGDGAVWQNATFSTGFDTAANDEGATNLRWDQFIAEANIDVAFGDGRITNIFGWRDVGQYSRTDLDGRPLIQFHADIRFDQDQISNELRYSGTPLPGVRFTLGAFYFKQDMGYIERRTLSGGATIGTLGGAQDSWTAAGFSAADIDITDQLILNLGLRYTKEHKSAQVATFSATAPRCDLVARSCVYDFTDSRSWNSWMPKVGLQWKPGEDLQFYGYWTRGNRSGGYNFRNINPRVPPGPIDQETQDAFEVGFKSDWFDRRLRLNGALFLSNLKNLQRDINLPNPVTGNAQVIRNTADARIQGVELEIVARPIPNLVLSGTLGYTDAHYTKVVFDINNDGRIDQKDLDLKLTRVAPWSYGVSATYEVSLSGSGSIAARGQYSHRDRAAYSDPNTTFLPSSDLVDASLTYQTEDRRFSLSLFGRNLTNDKTINTLTLTGFGLLQQPGKGRRYGLEANVSF
ncbi:MAG TPA: TonB-dependent receptor [Sphingobium sp.]